MHDDYMAFQLRMVLMVAQQPAAPQEDVYATTRAKAEQVARVHG